jgi:hypothetical protein
MVVNPRKVIIYISYPLMLTGWRQNGKKRCKPSILKRLQFLNEHCSVFGIAGKESVNVYENVPVRSGNTSVICMALRSVIELTRHSMI